MKKNFPGFTLVLCMYLVLIIISCKKETNIPSLAVKSMEVKRPPYKIGYLKGDTLNLYGLKIRIVVKNSFDSILILPYSQFKIYGIKCYPDSGNVLTTEGKTNVVITHIMSGKSTSQSITIYNTTTDVERNIYRIVTIGQQVWMAENLRTTKFNDGTNIPLIVNNTEWSNATSAGYSWYNNNELYAKNAKYGALYNGHTVMTGKVCPAGWHVASVSDWETLLNFVASDGHAGKALKSLKAINVWDWVDINGTDDYGFTLLPNGHRSLYDGTFHGAGSDIYGQYALYWTSTVINGYYNTASVSGWNNNVPSYSGEVNKSGAAIRCIKN